ncbi:hypothetical protein Pelo_19307 [Pelomyxa schiedti]|nr:hypothetical protein Pelo_19307 [Pelomyxa schiedti]
MKRGARPDRGANYPIDQEPLPQVDRADLLMFSTARVEHEGTTNTAMNTHLPNEGVLRTPGSCCSQPTGPISSAWVAQPNTYYFYPNNIPMGGAPIRIKRDCLLGDSLPKPLNTRALEALTLAPTGSTQGNRDGKQFITGNPTHHTREQDRSSEGASRSRANPMQLSEHSTCTPQQYAHARGHHREGPNQ